MVCDVIERANKKTKNDEKEKKRSSEVARKRKVGQEKKTHGMA